MQGVKFESSLAAGEARLVEALRLDGLAGLSSARWSRDRPPYPGLAAMSAEDAGVFFGRDAKLAEVLGRVNRLGQAEGALVVVIGPSGAGKSSLVPAGLAARLAVQPSDWAVVEPFEPGSEPLDRLVNRLVAVSGGRLSEDEYLQRLSSGGLVAVAEWLVDRTEPRASRLLVTVDQAEQLATVTARGERDRFVEALGPALGPGSAVTVVMTVRTDRLDDVEKLPVVGEAVHSPVLVGPMRRAQLAADRANGARRPPPGRPSSPPTGAGSTASSTAPTGSWRPAPSTATCSNGARRLPPSRPSSPPTERSQERRLQPPRYDPSQWH